MTTTTTVARTILQQLGGNRFIAMTGAHTLTDHGEALSFRIPERTTRDHINYVKIELLPIDEYELTFGRIHNRNYVVVTTIDFVPVENLRETFTRFTGLETQL